MNYHIDPKQIQTVDPNAPRDLRAYTVDARIADARLYGQLESGRLFNERLGAVNGAVGQFGGGLPDLASKIGR